MTIDLQTIQQAINAALTNLLTTVTLFLPQLINALILLLLGWFRQITLRIKEAVSLWIILISKQFPKTFQSSSFSMEEA